MMKKATQARSQSFRTQCERGSGSNRSRSCRYHTSRAKLSSILARRRSFYRGRERKVAFFVMSLPHSDAFFCQAFPRECTETFQEGHKRAFEFFRGVPYRISYDNSKIAVAKIVGRRGETPTKEFLRLESHYLFDHHFCLVRRPNEKGHTENLVGFARRNFMVPIPRNSTTLKNSIAMPGGSVPEGPANENFVVPAARNKRF